MTVFSYLTIQTICQNLPESTVAEIVNCASPFEYRYFPELTKNIISQ